MKKNHIVMIAILATVLVVLVILAVFVIGGETNTPTPTQPTAAPTEPTPAPTEPPTEPPITKVATATVSSVGDMSGMFYDCQCFN